MIYDNSGVRRQDRLLTEAEARGLLAAGEYGVLSMCDGGEAYGIPVSYVWDGAESLYIHCAPEGRKLRCLEAAPQVSFCVTGRTHVSRQPTKASSRSARRTSGFPRRSACGRWN